MAGEQYGKFVRESVYEYCAGCSEYTVFPPGTPTPSGDAQVRTCPACGTAITTTAYYTAALKDADRFD